MKIIITLTGLFVNTWVIICFFLPQLLVGQILQDTVKNIKMKPDTIQVPYEEIELDCLCVPKDKFIVIRSYTQLMELFKHADFYYCRDFSPTVFDFNKEVIIGFNTILARSGKRIPRFEFSITKILPQHKYVCEVKLIEYRAGGKLLHPVRTKIVFPITENDWEVEVKVIDYKNRFTQTDKSCNDYYR
ncbi:MAG: hypothetical protein B6I19_11445 [Bacteroidetes bacterium 4572_114]|nr:MAG: hypothetical protein B6I19_11445 [Bacteroidetes bacterium 4572_114]